MYDILFQSWIHGVDRQNRISDTKIKTSYRFNGENYLKVNNASRFITELFVVYIEGSIDMVNV
jgi:hypothetical protein